MKCSLIPAVVVAIAAITAITTSPAGYAESKERPKPEGTKVVEDLALPPQVKDSKGNVVPTITTRKTVGGETITEYRVRGKLYQQKIQPDKGPAYYLIDDKGEGKFSRVDGPEPKVAVPMWVLLEW